jgi:transposase InsO family protein
VLRRHLEPGQYTAIRYTDRLADAGALASIGSVGDSYDNALAES